MRQHRTVRMHWHAEEGSARKLQLRLPRPADILPRPATSRHSRPDQRTLAGKASPAARGSGPPAVTQMQSVSFRMIGRPRLTQSIHVATLSPGQFGEPGEHGKLTPTPHHSPPPVGQAKCGVRLPSWLIAHERAFW
mmetsp:Transcript_53556/g.150486  ORF Transcript_53556/g.150486 Transcript_53556/m.150486 type:complete len:136 (-) Transcript_53556:641-1048(-)